MYSMMQSVTWKHSYTHILKVQEGLLATLSKFCEWKLRYAEVLQQQMVMHTGM